MVNAVPKRSNVPKMISKTGNLRGAHPALQASILTSAVVAKISDGGPAPDLLSRYLEGASPEVLAREFGMSRPAVHAALASARAQRLLDMQVEFIDNPEFHQPGAESRICGPEPVVQNPDGRVRVPSGLPAYLEELYRPIENLLSIGYS